MPEDLPDGWERPGGNEWKELGDQANLLFVHAVTAGAIDENGQGLATPGTGPISAIMINAYDPRRDLHVDAVYLTPWKGLAVLHGQFEALAATLPVHVRDQYDALRADARRLAAEDVG
jgi:hypothetical protein